MVCFRCEPSCARLAKNCANAAWVSSLICSAVTAPNTSAAPALLGTTPGQLSSVLTLSGAAFGACASSALCRARACCSASWLMSCAELLSSEGKRVCQLILHSSLPRLTARVSVSRICPSNGASSSGSLMLKSRNRLLTLFNCMDRRHSCEATCAWPKPVML